MKSRLGSSSSVRHVPAKDSFPHSVCSPETIESVERTFRKRVSAPGEGRERHGLRSSPPRRASPATRRHPGGRVGSARCNGPRGAQPWARKSRRPRPARGVPCFFVRTRTRCAEVRLRDLRTSPNRTYGPKNKLFLFTKGFRGPKENVSLVSRGSSVSRPTLLSRQSCGTASPVTLPRSPPLQSPVSTFPSVGWSREVPTPETTLARDPLPDTAGGP